MNMNRWLYRAAGTVGIAGGFLLLGAGSAHADQASDTDPESMDALLGDVFSPTSGLPPLDLTGGDPTGSLASGALTLDPADGRRGQADRPATGMPELLPGLPGLPAGGLGSLLGGLPLGSVPLDSLGLPGGAVGAGGPLLSDDLLSVDGGAVGLPTGPSGPTGPGPRTLPAPAPVEAAPATGSAPEIVGSVPFLAQPLTNAVLGGGSLGNLVALGDLAGQVPVAGPMVSQTVGGVPLVSDVVPHQPRHAAPPARLRPVDPAARPADPAAGPVDPAAGPADPAAAPVGLPVDTIDPLGLAQPVTGGQLPAVIAQELATESGYSPELLAAPEDPEQLGGGLPFVGDGLSPLGRMFGVGNLPSQLPVVGPLTGSLTGNLPVVGNPAPAALAGPAALGPPAGLTGPATLGPGATTERPVAGEDPEYAESAPAELLPAVPGVGALPAAGLTNQLPLPSLAVLRALPVVGEVSGVLPL
jgi:hypothetical protein